MTKRFGSGTRPATPRMGGRGRVGDHAGQPAAPAPGCRAVELPDDLAAADSDLVQEITRDPYVFDFVRLQPGYRELDVQAALVADLRRLLV